MKKAIFTIAILFAGQFAYSSDVINLVGKSDANEVCELRVESQGESFLTAHLNLAGIKYDFYNLSNIDSFEGLFGKGSNNIRQTIIGAPIFWVGSLYSANINLDLNSKSMKVSIEHSQAYALGKIKIGETVRICQFK